MNNPSNEKWNADPEDCGNTLHIDREENVVLRITDLLTIHTFYWEELE